MLEELGGLAMSSPDRPTVSAAEPMGCLFVRKTFQLVRERKKRLIQTPNEKAAGFLLINLPGARSCSSFPPPIRH